MDRLAFQLLADAYVTLAARLREAEPSGAMHLFHDLEERVAGALARFHASAAAGAASADLLMAVGAKVGAAMDEAHGRVQPDEADF